MSTVAIFLLGFFVTTTVVAAASLVGLSEAGDPSHSRLPFAVRSRHLVRSAG